ncbi:hypothetical protein [Azospirillum halopraeferens]|uniref:hypothetical protein n=1 Tax=Azospirillum halopraeferens TaxID=34010 RepID=UPI000409B571|nr:hypothetical protein [Azospirillum halopraeferens]
MLRTVLAAGLVAGGVMLALNARSATGGGDGVDRLWAAVDGTAAAILDRREGDWRGPGSSYAPVGERSYTLNRLLDEAVDRLSQGSAADLRARIAGLRRDLAARESDVARLRAELAALPEDRCDAAGVDASFVARQVSCLFATSRGDQIERIAQARRDIGHMTEEIDRLTGAFAASLTDVGIELTPEQVDGLLRLATAENIVAAHTVYENLRQVNAELQRVTIASDESLEVARRYYGVYAVLLEVALHMHERFLDTVRHEHLPRLAGIEADARRARAEAARLLAREGEGPLSAQLDANLSALDTTLEAAGLYRQTLEEQSAAVSAAWERVARQRDVAVNTWRTVRASADMLAMMSETGRAFETLMDLQLPPPRAFANQQLEREFERLTARLVADRR